jgi:NAD+ synthase (glutamine-hydrolysing)
MHSLRVGIANINPTIGAVYSNVKKMMEARTELLGMASDIDVISFSELCVCGYPPEDMIQWPDFIGAQMDALMQFVDACDDNATYLVGAIIEHSGGLYNCVVVISDQKIVGIVPKEKLPTYGIFYDGRTVTPGKATFEWWNPVQTDLDLDPIPFGDMTFQLGDVCQFGTEDCEDGWVPDGPMTRRSYNGAEVIFNLSASPSRPGIHAQRRRMLATRSADNCVGLVYTNQVGGNDSLVSDGGAYIYELGKEIKITNRWKENVSVVDINLDNIRRERNSNTTWRTNRREHTQTDNIVAIDHLNLNHNRVLKFSPKNSAGLTAAESFIGSMGEDAYAVNPVEEMKKSILLGMQDYYNKAAPFQGEVISLSGGRDSVLVLLYAYQNAIARGDDPAEQIFCYSMPTTFNSDDTKSIARDVCDALGVSFVEESIQDAFESEKARCERMIGGPLSRLAKQNLQARLRATLVRTIANSKGAILWQTGSMSEKATGYTTLGGDMEGDYSPISNVPKTVEELLLMRELELAKWNIPLAKVLRKLLEETVASAELEEDQDDQSELAPFPVLDTCFKMFFGEKLGYHDILAQIEARLGSEQLLAIDKDYSEKMKGWVRNCLTRFLRSVYKWIQMCQGIHLLDVDLDRERALQIPAVQSLEWLRMDQ